MIIMYRDFEIEVAREVADRIDYTVYYKDLEIETGYDKVSRSVKDTAEDCKKIVDKAYEEPEMWDLEDILFYPF